MSVNLKKGGNISLTKMAEDTGTSLENLIVACGWDVKKKGILSRGKGYDLDLSAAGLDATGKIPNWNDPTDPDWQEWFIFGNHRQDSARSVIFMGDNRTGAGDGDDEMIDINLPKVPGNIERIVFAVVIWQAQQRGNQTFGEVENAFIRVFDRKTGKEFARYNLGADFADETLVMFGELYRRGNEWKFKAIGQGYDARSYRQAFNIVKHFESDYARYPH